MTSEAAVDALQGVSKLIRLLLRHTCPLLSILLYIHASCFPQDFVKLIYIYFLFNVKVMVICTESLS